MRCVKRACAVCTVWCVMFIAFLTKKQEIKHIPGMYRVDYSSSPFGLDIYLGYQLVCNFGFVEVGSSPGKSASLCLLFSFKFAGGGVPFFLFCFLRSLLLAVYLINLPHGLIS